MGERTDGGAGNGLVVGELPAGCVIRCLRPHDDDRGTLTEVFLADWLDPGPHVAQLNVVRSRAGVLRGVHVHEHHADVLHLIAGEMHVGLRDLRGALQPGALVRLTADDPVTITIPAGVAHGFHFPVDSVYCYALTARWTGGDDMGCHWADSGLGIPWEVTGEPILSPRDRDAGTLDELRRRWRERIRLTAAGTTPAVPRASAG